MNFLISRISELFLNQDGTFNDDTSGGQTASFVPAQWLNNIGQELVNLIESVGLTPDENNPTQIAQTLDIAAPYQQIILCYVDLNDPDPVPGWRLCDGTNGTPGMLDHYLRMGAPGLRGGSTYATTENGYMEIDGTSLSEAQGAVHTHGLDGRLITSSGDTEGSSGRYSDSGTQDTTDTKILDSAGGVSHDHTGRVLLQPTYYTLAPFMRADYADYLLANGGL